MRRKVFCGEQAIFERCDADEHDAVAKPIVAVAEVMGMPESVVGVVRIHPSGPGVWYGSRLAVQDTFRGVGGLGAGLIRKAVSTAAGLGCRRFLATVQRQNVALFRRLHWRTLEEIDLHGRPHHLMEADLAFYPPCDEGAPIAVGPARRAS